MAQVLTTSFEDVKEDRLGILDSKKNQFIDIDLKMDLNPVTKDITVKKDISAINQSLKNNLFTQYERLAIIRDLEEAMTQFQTANNEEKMLAADKYGKQLGELKEDLKVEVNTLGVLNTIKLQHENEPARHKLLDVIGDLGLIGAPIKGKIITNRPGHTANVQFARVLKKAYLKSGSKINPLEE